jgi:hypothetical protein
MTIFSLNAFPTDQLGIVADAVMAVSSMRQSTKIDFYSTTTGISTSSAGSFSLGHEKFLVR